MRVRFSAVLIFFTAVLSILSVVAQRADRSAAKASKHEVSAVDRVEAVRLNNIGAAFLGQQRFGEGERMFERAYALDPNLAAARLNEAIALLNQQKLDAARGILLSFLKRHPDNARAWYNLGLLYKAIGKAQEALAAFARAAQLAPDDADAFYFLGATAAQLRQSEKAIAAFEKALKLNPYHASAEFGLARVYQQSGNLSEARKHLATFQQLTKTKLGTPMTLAYGDQGPLSLAEQVRVPQVQHEPAIKVMLTQVDDSGITPVYLTGRLPSNPIIADALCVLDYDGDGLPDVYTGNGKLYHNLGNGKFENRGKDAGVDRFSANACAAGDFDNDGHTDLAVAIGHKVVLYRNQGNGTFKDVTQAAGITGQADITGLTWVDFDHDGDLDLYVTVAGDASGTKGKNILWRNNGNGTFTNWTAETALNGTSPSVMTAPADFNEDRAIDLLVTGQKTQLFMNPREGKWRVRDDLPGGTVGAAVADFDKHGSMDVALTEDHAPGLQLFRNEMGKRWRPVALPNLHWKRAFGVVAFDYDNDGWIDIAALGETAGGKSELRILRNEGAKGFRDVSAEVGADKINLQRAREIVAVDYDHDGDSDLMIGEQGAPTLVLRNDGGSQNHALRLALKGLNDNKSSFGAKVEVYAGELYQEFQYTGAGLMGQGSEDLIVGLGNRQQADVVRVLWPTGVVQDEVNIGAGKTAEISEIDRRGSSCPILFAWNGKQYEFVTDMLGAGVLGHWVAPGERNIPDATEYVNLDTVSPVPHNGRLSFRLMEPMEEVVYIDQLRLLAIDHPADSRVYPNEYFASNPPYPSFKVISSRNPEHVTAWNDDGKDVTELLGQRDHRYVSGFNLLPFKGFTQPHTLVLDLAHKYEGGPLRLLMSGYIEYFTATSMYAANQAGVHPIAPYVEALLPNGRWVRVMDDMGFPAGLPRTITVDLTGKLPVGARRIRITTNLQIYWDQVLVDRSEQLPPVASPARDGIMVHDVPLANVQLRFHGYPQAVEGTSPGDLSYRYDVVSATGPYARERGAYTRLGDVTPLLRQVDDRFAIFGSGEELAVDFDPSQLPAVPSGWKRDYFFFADGYEKDMDFYAADPNTVSPLPYRTMGTYPPKQSYPDDDAHIRYRLEYDTRFIDGTEPRSYRFHYGHR